MSAVQHNCHLRGCRFIIAFLIECLRQGCLAIVKVNRFNTLLNLQLHNSGSAVTVIGTDSNYFNTQILVIICSIFAPINISTSNYADMNRVVVLIYPCGCCSVTLCICDLICLAGAGALLTERDTGLAVYQLYIDSVIGGILRESRRSHLCVVLSGKYGRAVYCFHSKLRLVYRQFGCKSRSCSQGIGTRCAVSRLIHGHVRICQILIRYGLYQTYLRVTGDNRRDISHDSLFIFRV